MSKKLIFQNLTKNMRKIKAQERTSENKSVVQKMKYKKNFDRVCTVV